MSVSMPEPSPEFMRLVTQLVRWEQDGLKVDAKIGPYSMFTLIGSMQMCCRHPSVGGSMEVLRELADQLTDNLIGGYAPDNPDGPRMRTLIEMGWDPVNDV